VFFRGSRYETVGEDAYTDRTGQVIRYKRIRFIPNTPAQLAHVVLQGERVDHVAFLAYRDPERFWRICDANLVMRPDELVEQPGARILIPQAKG
jgi:hypothetical protein